jgi:CheY-like chemotaxis protein
MPERERLLLIVDDHSAIRSTFLHVARACDIEAAAVASGLEAVAFCRTRRPTAILMDLWLPDIDGFEATARILAEAGEKRPVILGCSAYNDAEYRQRAVASGMIRLLPKSLDLSQFREAIEGAFLLAETRVSAG